MRRIYIQLLVESMECNDRLSSLAGSPISNVNRVGRSLWNLEIWTVSDLRNLD